MAESTSFWNKRLDAIGRKLGLPNPIRQKSKEVGKELTATEFIENEKIGNPLNHYHKDRREEVYAFFVGYNGIPLKTYLRNLENMKFHTKVELDGLHDKITKAYAIGRNAAIEDGELKTNDERNLESQVNKTFSV